MKSSNEHIYIICVFVKLRASMSTSLTTAESPECSDQYVRNKLVTVSGQAQIPNQEIPPVC